MAPVMASSYNKWTVNKLKTELSKRGVDDISDFRLSESVSGAHYYSSIMHSGHLQSQINTYFTAWTHLIVPAVQRHTKLLTRAITAPVCCEKKPFGCHYNLSYTGVFTHIRNLTSAMCMKKHLIAPAV